MNACAVQNSRFAKRKNSEVFILEILLNCAQSNKLVLIYTSWTNVAQGLYLGRYDDFLISSYAQRWLSSFCGKQYYYLLFDEFFMMFNVRQSDCI